MERYKKFLEILCERSEREGVGEERWFRGGLDSFPLHRSVAWRHLQKLLGLGCIKRKRDAGGGHVWWYSVVSRELPEECFIEKRVRDRVRKFRVIPLELAGVVARGRLEDYREFLKKLHEISEEIGQGEKKWFYVRLGSLTKSPSVAWRHLQKLLELGCIKRRRGGLNGSRWYYRIVTAEIPDEDIGFFCDWLAKPKKKCKFAGLKEKRKSNKKKKENCLYINHLFSFINFYPASISHIEYYYEKKVKVKKNIGMDERFSGVLPRSDSLNEKKEDIVEEEMNNPVLSIEVHDKKTTEEEMVELWNQEFRASATPIVAYSSDKLHLPSILKSHFNDDLREWVGYARQVNSSKYLMGETAERPQVASFDWLLRSDSIIKIRKGEYGVGTRPLDVQRLDENVERLKGSLYRKIMDICCEKIELSISAELERDFHKYVEKGEYAYDGDPLCIGPLLKWNYSAWSLLNKAGEGAEKVYNNCFRNFVLRKSMGFTEAELKEKVDKFISSSLGEEVGIGRVTKLRGLDNLLSKSTENGIEVVKKLFDERNKSQYISH